MSNSKLKFIVWTSFVLLWLTFTIICTLVLDIKINFWITAIVYFVIYTFTQMISFNWIKKVFNKIRVYRHNKEIDDWIKKESMNID